MEKCWGPLLIELIFHNGAGKDFGSMGGYGTMYQQALKSTGKSLCVKGAAKMEGKLCEEQLMSLGLFSMGKTERPPHFSLQLLHRGRGGTDTDLISGDQWQDLGEWPEAVSSDIFLVLILGKDS